MADFLESLRKKNNQEKKAFALLTSAIIAGGIFLIWLLTVLATWDSRFANGLSLDLPSLDTQEQTEPVEEITPEETPFNIVWSTSTVATSTSTTTPEE